MLNEEHGHTVANEIENHIGRPPCQSHADTHPQSVENQERLSAELVSQRLVERNQRH